MLGELVDIVFGVLLGEWEIGGIVIGYGCMAAGIVGGGQSVRLLGGWPVGSTGCVEESLLGSWWVGDMVGIVGSVVGGKVGGGMLAGVGGGVMGVCVRWRVVVLLRMGWGCGVVGVISGLVCV